jgi:hypothetical protein
MGRRWAFSLLVGLFLLSGLVAAENQEKRKATLVERLKPIIQVTTVQ